MNSSNWRFKILQAIEKWSLVCAFANANLLQNIIMPFNKKTYVYYIAIQMLYNVHCQITRNKFEYTRIDLHIHEFTCSRSKFDARSLFLSLSLSHVKIRITLDKLCFRKVIYLYGFFRSIATSKCSNER